MCYSAECWELYESYVREFAAGIDRRHPYYELVKAA